MASMKREETSTQHEEEQPESKRPKYPSDQIHPVSLNPADCDLSFNIEDDGLTGHGLSEEGFAYCWSGARGTVGINGGKYYFGCRVISDQPVKMEDTPVDQQNVCRVGISRGEDAVGNLGETEYSYGFGGTGKFSNAGNFVDYGETFGIGDTIICLVDLESEPWGSIEFCKNGRCLGIAKKFDSSPKGLSLTDTSAVFPHVLLKNTVVKMQFSMEDGLLPIEGYKPWASAMEDKKAIVGPSLAKETDCEVIMMVGLPASGKSTWAERWVKERPEKRYVLLGTNLVLDQMKVPGLLRKNNYGERFEKLMHRATGIFNTLLTRASKVPRNYIIDQTNVYKSARKRKLKPFAFYHKIAVVVFPRAEELRLRAEKRFQEMGKDVPPEAINEMLANFVLPMSKDMPGTDEYFDRVIFTNLGRSEAQRELDEMKRANSGYSVPSSREKHTIDHSAYSQRSYSIFHPYSGHANSGYSVPSVSARVAAGCSWAGYPQPAAPAYTANINTGYTGYIQPAFGSYGYQNPDAVRHYGPSYSEHQNPIAYGGYPASLQHPGSAGHYVPIYSPPQYPRAYGHPANIQYGTPGYVAYVPPRF